MANECDDTEVDSELTFVGFELSECVLNLDTGRVKYLRAIHRTALELGNPESFWCRGWRLLVD
jgi:hypothetical protein